ncbi:MAG: type VI secretion system contractile sheath small subunit [Thiohalomonadales bacterium]
MADSFQKEIPKARVNITLDVETGGARKKLELPMKLLSVGDFSGGKTKGKLAHRERIDINKNNIESVLNELSPQAKYTVDNVIANDDTEISVKLEFDSFKAFHPESVVKQIPQLENLLSMRNLLKDLKSNLLDNGTFRKELEKIIKNQPELEDLRSELEKLAPDANSNETEVSEEKSTSETE